MKRLKSLTDGNQWEGKKWYVYGTSLTERPGVGTYSRYLAALAGLEEHNFGKGGSGIYPPLHGDDNIKTRCMRLDDGKAEADLITVEIIPNDASAPVGTPLDTGDDTFLGNLAQILRYLQENTRAQIVVLIVGGSRYNHKNDSELYPPESAVKTGFRAKADGAVALCARYGIPCWDASSEAGLGFWRVGAQDRTYIPDQIHLTELGGYIVAQYFWSKLKDLPTFSTSLPELDEE